MLSRQYLEQCALHKQHIENQILVLLIFFLRFVMPIYVSSIDGIRKKGQYLKALSKQKSTKSYEEPNVTPTHKWKYFSEFNPPSSWLLSRDTLV